MKLIIVTQIIFFLLFCMGWGRGGGGTGEGLGLVGGRVGGFKNFSLHESRTHFCDTPQNIDSPTNFYVNGYIIRNVFIGQASSHTHTHKEFVRKEIRPISPILQYFLSRAVNVGYDVVYRTTAKQLHIRED